jgi:hypothetical protein
MQNKKLKLGLLLDSFDVPAWVHSVVQRIVNEDSGEFALVILNDDAASTKRTNRKVSIYSVFNHIDEKLFTKEPNPFDQKNIENLLPNVPVIKALPVKNNNISFLSEADKKNIRKYQLDILIKFGFEGLQIETLDASKYGAWFYYHGDDRIMKGGPPGFWEVVENWSETGSALLSVGGNFSAKRVLFRSHFVTYPLSPARHRSYYFWAAASFLPRQISLLQQLGEEKYCQETEKFNTALLREIKSYEEPSNLLAVISIAKIAARLVKEAIKRFLYVDQWFLLFSFKQDISGDFSEYNKLIPAKNKFWADPHAVQINDRYYIFIEEFLQSKNKGHISVIELDETGIWKAPIKVLETGYHLSNPFVFKWNNTFFMVPESRANKTIDLYECTEFPDKWIFKQHLMENISAVDTTLFHYSDKWWLFTAMAENAAAAPNVELFLFYADDLLSGEWTAHPRNPIISDVKSARPAGSLFVENGKLFRPSQDCSKAYGYGFDLNEIEILSETEYRERKIISIRPNWDRNIRATHTYANCGKLTVIDAFTQTLKFG